MLFWQLQNPQQYNISQITYKMYWRVLNTDDNILNHY